jgi:ligand-binding sensor domain-containing protein/signal transduction histidine kinase
MKYPQTQRFLFFLEIFWVLPTLATLAQPPKFWHLSVQDGLSNATVTCMLQDQQGFMWFGTDDGLNRYDGHQFKVYRKSLGDSLGLFDNLIESICEDREGNLWIATAYGLNRYLPKLDRMERVQDFRATFFALMLDGQGNLWAGGNQQLARRDGQTGRWVSLSHLFVGEHVFSAIAQTSPDDFWISSNGKGLYHLHWPSQKLTHFAHNPQDPNSLTDNTIYNLFADNKGALWITTYYGGISRFDLKLRKFTNFKAQNGKPGTLLTNGVTGVCQAHGQLFFTVENGGVGRYEPETSTFTHFLHDPADPKSVVSNAVRSIYADRQGRVWVGTYAKGLSIWDQQRDKFERFVVGRASPVVNALHADRQDRLWVGTEEGLLLQEKDKVSYFQHKPDNARSLGANPVLRIHEDPRGRIWLGTWLGGISQWQEKEQKFANFISQRNANSIGTTNLNCVFALADANGQLLVGSYGGLHLFNETSQQYTDFVGQGQRAKIEYVHDVEQDHEGNWWVASLTGLHRFAAQTGEHTTYLNQSNDSTSLSNNACLSLTVDRQHQLWIGTRFGLNLWVAPGKFRRFTTAQGLPNNEVLSITPDAQGKLWLATNRGLARLDPATANCESYDESDGLGSKQFRANASTTNRQGEILLGTTSGIVRFHPDSVRINPLRPPVVLTGLRLFNRPVTVGGADSLLPQAITHATTLTLRPEHTVFTLEFAALNFTQNEKSQYAYRLEPFEKEWNQVGNQRNATYTNLDPGTYLFRVKASNNDGLWNETGAWLTIEVLPHWWATWWFRWLAGAIIVGAALLFYLFRVSYLQHLANQLEQTVLARTKDLANANEELVQQKEELEQSNEYIKIQSAELEELNKQKDKLFSIVSHDLRSPMASLKNTIELMDLDVLDKEELSVIKKELKRQFKATDEMLQSLLAWAESQMQGEKIIPQWLDLGQLVAETTDFLGGVAEAKKIDTVIEVPVAIQVYADPNHLRAILRNLIANAVKFSFRGGKVLVSGQLEGSLAVVSVRDWGQGMSAPQRERLFGGNYVSTRGTAGEWGTGLGLRLVKDLVEKNGGKLWVESQEGQGSTFSFTLKNTNE